jgi:Zn finger protein HypA/HybF involved in hydrogenase expression
MYETTNKMYITLSELQLKKHALWMKEWTNGLAYCRNCDKEYTDQETLFADTYPFCPHCKQEEDKAYYYCKEHGGSVCKECDHNV